MAKKALHASWLSYPHVCLDIIKNINIFLKAKGAGDEPSHSPSHDTPEKTSDCWMREQWHGWSDRYPWLYLKVSKLGDSLCRDAKTLLLSDRGPGIHFPDEWINGVVGSSCKKTLAKKLYKQSASHQRATEIASQKQKEMLPKKVMEMNEGLTQETLTSSRTAYNCKREIGI